MNGQMGQMIVYMVILRSPRTTTLPSDNLLWHLPPTPWQAICWTEKGLKKCAAIVPKQDTDAGCLFSFSHNAHSRIKDTTIGTG